MKRIFAGLLTLCLLAALTVPCLAAESGGVVQTVKALGILTGDESGNTDLYGAVSRAEFASMMAAASSYKDSVSREGSHSAGSSAGLDDGLYRPDLPPGASGDFGGSLRGTFEAPGL